MEVSLLKSALTYPLLHPTNTSAKVGLIGSLSIYDRWIIHPAWTVGQQLILLEM